MPDAAIPSMRTEQLPYLLHAGDCFAMLAMTGLPVLNFIASRREVVESGGSKGAGRVEIAPPPLCGFREPFDAKRLNYKYLLSFAGTSAMESVTVKFTL